MNIFKKFSAKDLAEKACIKHVSWISPLLSNQQSCGEDLEVDAYCVCVGGWGGPGSGRAMSGWSNGLLAAEALSDILGCLKAGCVSPKGKLVSQALLREMITLVRPGERFAPLLFSQMDFSITKAQNVIYCSCRVTYNGNNLYTFFFCCLYNFLGFLRSNERQRKWQIHGICLYHLLGPSAFTNCQFRKSYQVVFLK